MDNLHNVRDHPRLLRQLRSSPCSRRLKPQWLNLIEPHFGVMKRFTLANTDDLEHVLRRRRI
jgi:hypothetical protein